jgi:UDPglucose 6-dehydrogenase
MKVSVIGTGYVGLVTGVCLAEVGHHVTCVDIDPDKISNLRKGISPIYEPGIEEILDRNIVNGNLSFTDDISHGVADAEVIYIAVGTPSKDDGRADLRYVESAAMQIAQVISSYTVVVTKSTVPVGTNHRIKEIISQHKINSCEFDVVSNPEFLREGSAIYDTFHGERIVVGSESEQAATIIAKVYEPFETPIINTDIRSAEMIKYAANAFLATKISFINEIANICEKVGANVEDVALGMGKDSRIGEKFLHSGIGYGGSCFPKDTKALVQIASNSDYDFDLLRSVISVNNNQQRKLVDKAIEHYGDLKGKTVAVLGLSFKPNTDDMRDAASVRIINQLKELECKVKVYDPIAIPNAKLMLGEDEISYCSSAYQALTEADFAMIVTEWDEFKKVDLDKMKDLLIEPVIFDGRNCFSLKEMEEKGFTYYSIGRPVVRSTVKSIL